MLNRWALYMSAKADITTLRYSCEEFDVILIIKMK